MKLYVDIKKRFRNFSLDVKFETDSLSTAIFGMSASGKSLTLKCIAGLVTPDSGKIVLDDVVLFDCINKINVKQQKRSVGYLFQELALFPNMTVAENILCGLNKHKKHERYILLETYLNDFKLDCIRDLYPHQISVGQKQRVALARTLASDPKLLLLDEPFSALDSSLKEELQFELSASLIKYNKHYLFVSHDKSEVYRFCDKVCVFDNGLCRDVKSTKSLFEAPCTINEAKLVGIENIISLNNNIVAIRAKDILIDSKTDNVFKGIIDNIAVSFDRTLTKINSENFSVVTDFLTKPCIGQEVLFGFDNDKIIILDR